MEHSFLAHKVGVKLSDNQLTYIGRHRTPEIPKGVYGVSLGSRKRGMWLNEVADRDSDPNVR